MRNEKSLLIPLSEPIGYLKQSILEFALMKTHADSNSAARLNRCFNYDVLPYWLTVNTPTCDAEP